MPEPIGPPRERQLVFPRDHADLDALSGDDFLDVYRVNVVFPSMVTGRWHLEYLGQERYDAQMRSRENATPLHRRVNPEDVAATVVWLIEGAEVMTGQALVVDSGSLLGAAPSRI
jgi:NAD(P)-dependent dehydrogenase (short-subunit alcohol dehydrogenase family)